MAGLAATGAGDILDYAWDHPQPRPITGELPYFIALPTTAGTGSKVGRCSVIGEDDTHLKRVLFSHRLMAWAARCQTTASSPRSCPGWSRLPAPALGTGPTPGPARRRILKTCFKPPGEAMARRQVF